MPATRKSPVKRTAKTTVSKSTDKVTISPKRKPRTTKAKSNAKVKTTATQGVRATTAKPKAKSTATKAKSTRTTRTSRTSKSATKVTAKAKTKAKAKPRTRKTTKVTAVRNVKSGAIHKLRKKLVPYHAKPVMQTAEALEIAIRDYFEWCDNNPWLKQVGYDKEGIPITIPKKRPYIIEGLCAHIGISRQHWYGIQDATKKCYREDLSQVIEWASNVFYTQVVTGGLVEDFNPQVATRLLGLSDKRELGGRTSPDGKAEAIQVQINKEVEFEANEVVRKLLKD